MPRPRSSRVASDEPGCTHAGPAIASIGTSAGQATFRTTLSPVCVPTLRKPSRNAHCRWRRSNVLSTLPCPEGHTRNIGLNAGADSVPRPVVPGRAHPSRRQATANHTRPRQTDSHTRPRVSARCARTPQAKRDQSASKATSESGSASAIARGDSGPCARGAPQGDLDCEGWDRIRRASLHLVPRDRSNAVSATGLWPVIRTAVADGGVYAR
jgi:hypothetical protein